MSSVARLQDTRGNVDYCTTHDVGKALALLMLSARIFMFAKYYRGTHLALVMFSVAYMLVKYIEKACTCNMRDVGQTLPHNVQNCIRCKNVSRTNLAHVMLLIILGFNDTSTLVSHFVSSPREKEKSDRRGSRGDERRG